MAVPEIRSKYFINSKALLPYFSVVFASCSATQNPAPNKVESIPSCINNKIGLFKNAPKQNPPRSVTEYTYKRTKVYYIPAPCCDQYSDLFDSNCNLLGHPDGGITGRGDGTLNDFSAEATNEKLLWKDDR